MSNTSARKELLGMLGNVSLFDGLSRRELRRVLDASKEVNHRPGARVVEEGAPGVGFHLILEGTAKVVSGGRTRAKLGPGDYFGELSLLDKGPRTATVLADTALRTRAISSWMFVPLLDDHPQIARKLLVELCKRIRSTERSLTH